VKEVVNLPELKKRSNQLTKKYWAIFLLTLSIVFSNIAYSIDADIKLPDGFQIELYTDQVPGARSLAQGDNYLFVSSMEEGNLYAINIDGPSREVNNFISGLYIPNGIAYHDGDLYVAEIHRVLKFENIEDAITSGKEPEYTVISKYPTDRHHGWRYIVIGGDDRIYVPIGAPCNVCDDEGYAVITSMNLDGSDKRIIAEGIRNSVGMTFHPITGELWFTDNGRDMLGDDIPPCELNKLSYEGEHFGFPFCHGNDIQDPQYGSLGQCSNITIPIQELGPHVAPLGLKFYTGDMFPEEYHNQVFISEHGSWNRSKKIGYRITMVTLDESQSTSYQTFADGWLEDEKTLGRPVDILVMKDGSMLVSDDHNGAIYRITYTD